MMTTRQSPTSATRDSERFDPMLVRCASVGVALVLSACTSGCGSNDSPTPSLLGGVELQSDTLPALHERLSLMITSAPAPADWHSGLAGAVGGARVKLFKTGEHELISVVPQLTEAQIPVSYAVTVTPPEATIELRFATRPGTVTNLVLDVRLQGQRGQEVEIDWSAVLLLIPPLTNATAGAVDLYRRETSCAQSSAEGVMTLAGELWPGNGTVCDFAVNIQGYIGGMQQHAPPKSMDAAGILESGGNWICTANANLAVALLRAKGVPARSLAVIPPTGQRLEMHRIVEYHDSGRWLRFDPSSIHRDIPMKHWQSVVMATSTPEDEDLAMKPRMGSSTGAPYGQELEFVSGRLTFTGPQFFWTVARPLVGFEADAETADLARKAWLRFLETGQLGQDQISAAVATNAAGFRGSWSQ